MSDTTTIITPIEASNSLADLAARIKIEHTAVSDSLKQSVRHGIAAGELLLEAEAKLNKHGQWLPWLRDHCSMAERTAQLYMRLAKNREAIEIRNDVADLTLNEAAALLVLTSDIRKLFNFARDMEHLSGDELVGRCIADGVGVIRDLGYNMFAGRSDAEVREWHLFAAFESYDGDAHRVGGDPLRVWDHVEWILQRPFQNVTEWLSEEADRWRKSQVMGVISEQFKSDWAAYRDAHRDWTLAEVEEQLKRLQQRFEQERTAGIIKPLRSRTQRWQRHAAA